MKRSRSIMGLVLLASIEVPKGAMAQVVPDNTVGTTVNAAGNIFTINNGTRSGNNLFHSFSQFSLPTNGSAIFNNATDVHNIFSRVTGSQLSNIDGILKTQGSANLFLMNPNGILFGPNAQLELGGSFVGTTANSIKFEDGIEFSSANLTTTPLLSVKVPIGLQMVQNSGQIQVQGMGHRLASPQSAVSPYRPYEPYSGLQVKPNQTLALIGRDIDFIGGVLQAPSGRIEINSLAQAGIVKLQSIDQGFATIAQDIQNFGQINLTQRSSLETGGITPGQIQIQGGVINIQDGSLIFNRNFGSQSGGTIAINATQSLTLSSAIPSLNILSSIDQNNFGTGTGGSILIRTPNLLVQSGTSIFSRNYGTGAGGPVLIEVENLRIIGFAETAPDALSRVGTLSTLGKSGNVSVKAQTLSLQQGGFLGSVNFLQGQGQGDVWVNAETIDINGISAANISSAIGAYNLGLRGRAGNVTLTSRTLTALNGGLVGSSSIGAGDAGNIQVTAHESIAVSGFGDLQSYGSSISSSVTRPIGIYQQLFGLPPTPSGAAGSILITTPSLLISNGGIVGVSNSSVGGGAGALKLDAGKIKLDDNAYILAATVSGNGGDIEIKSNWIEMRNNAAISSTAFGNQNQGTGGDIKINSLLIVGLGNSDISANASQGRGGNVTITTQGLFGIQYHDRLTSGNDITASSEFGINGNVYLNTIGINPTNALNTLPTDIVDSSRQLNDRCGVARTSSFIATGRGGMPPSPMKRQGGDRPWTDVRPLTPTNSSVPVAMTNPIQPLVEASALQIDKSGSMALVAANPIASQLDATCGMGADQ
jgi:filamentous hemagglutinin family protein